MNKQILLAKSGSKYLKIQMPGQKTIIIFETQIYIFDYIFSKLNVVNKDIYDIDMLTEYCANESYYIFLRAYDLRDDLKDYWESFFTDPEYDNYKDCGQYDPQYYGYTWPGDNDII